MGEAWLKGQQQEEEEAENMARASTLVHRLVVMVGSRERECRAGRLLDGMGREDGVPERVVDGEREAMVAVSITVGRAEGRIWIRIYRWITEGWKL